MKLLTHGIVLSPIRYIKYVSALRVLSQNGHIHSYADETVIIIIFDSILTEVHLIKKKEYDMTSPENWFRNYK